MNNAKIAISLQEEKSIDIKPQLRQRQEELMDIIGAIEHIAESSYWKVLEEKIFTGLVDTINKRLQETTDEKELYRLQGQAIWAKKYSDLSSLAEIFRNELTVIKNQING